jgi:gliding motility-associated transport system ATP-binding protein
MHDPPVLVLDEPTDGLDPNQKHGVRRLIGEMAEDKAIIISTHILEEVEAICTRAVIVARGRVVADARPDELKRRSRHHNAVRLTVNANLQPKLRPPLEGLPGVQAVEVVGAVNGVTSLLVVPEPGREVVHEVGELIRSSGVAVDELVVEQGRLDDVFRELTARAH